MYNCIKNGHIIFRGNYSACAGYCTLAGLPLHSVVSELAYRELMSGD